MERVAGVLAEDCLSLLREPMTFDGVHDTLGCSSGDLACVLASLVEEGRVAKRYRYSSDGHLTSVLFQVRR